MSDIFKNAKRIVIKIGSSLLVDEDTGQLKEKWLASLCADIADLQKSGKQVLVVSSGSIALGRTILGLDEGVLKLEDSQAAAATGQIALAQFYQQHLAKHGLIAAQILLTLSVTEERRQYLNARNTLEGLLQRGAVPVINENDTVATTEIRYGDNDRLAARVAGMVGADYIIILSDIDGLYSANPDEDDTAEFIANVSAITPEITAMAGKKRTKMGSGGMETKIEAARMSLASGNNMIISSGTTEHPIKHLIEGGRHTLFAAQSTPKSAREQWITNTFEPTGSLIIDAGAEKALHSGKSLLPAGVSSVDGTFERGDTVLICNQDGVEIARGIIAYDIADARRILGHKSLDIENMLGYRGRDELVHRDDMVMTAQDNISK